MEGTHLTSLRAKTLALVSAAALGAGLMAAEAQTSETTAPDCITAEQTGPYKISAEMPFDQVAREVSETTFFLNPDERTAENRDNYIEILARKGIKVTNAEAIKDVRNVYGELMSSKTWLYDAMSQLPISLVEASGVKKIEVVADNGNTVLTDSELELPINTADTLFVGSTGRGFYDGLAGMILDNYCGPAKRGIYEEFQTITHKAGRTYDAASVPKYNDEAAGRTFVAKFGKDVFKSQETVRSPREELIDYMSELLYHSDFGSVPRTPAGQKQAIARQLFDSIEPHGAALRANINYGAYWGTHGLHPQEIPIRVQCIANEYSEADTGAQRERIRNADFYGQPDPQVRNCDAIAQSLVTGDFLSSLGLRLVPVESQDS